MTKSEVPVDAYTYEPEQHPNLILGSVQLLFWLIVRPRAWANNLRRINGAFKKDVNLLQVLKGQRWQKPNVRRFLIQQFIVLPSLLSLLTGLVSWWLGTPLDVTLLSVALGLVLGIGLGIGLGIVFSVVLGGAFGAAFSVALSIGYGVSLSVTVGIIGGLACGIASSVAYRMTHGPLSSLIRGLILGGIGTALPFYVGDISYGVTSAIAFVLGLLINGWRPVVLAFLLAPWHWWLYRLDRSRSQHMPSLLCEHLTFWDEWQSLPIPGLGSHLLLILEKRPAEGRAALDYLSKGRQRRVAHVAQIELEARRLERCDTTTAIGQVHGNLAIGELHRPADKWLRRFGDISAEVAAMLNQGNLPSQQRTLTAISANIMGLAQELSHGGDRYAVRFYPIAQRWNNIVALTLENLTQDA